MSTNWLWRVIAIVPETDKPALNALWTIIAPGGDAEADTFGVPLSGSGNDPATWRGMDTAATASMRGMIELLTAGELAAARVYFCDKDYLLEAQHNGKLTIGQGVSMADALAAHGLKKIETGII